jgi:hypothetical protein
MLLSFIQPWEWCIAHLLNCALVEAFGICVDKKASKNPECRDILSLVKKVIEGLNKSMRKKVGIQSH